MKKYKRKLQDVTAVQWNKHGDYKLVFKNGDEGVKWSFKDCSLCGKSADQHGHLNTIHSGKIICPGTWIVQRSDGVQTYSDEEFKAKYEAVE